MGKGALLPAPDFRGLIEAAVAAIREQVEAGLADRDARIAIGILGDGSTPLAVSGVTLPPGSTVSLCERAWEAEWAEIPEDRYVAIADTKLTGRLNFDCGKFQYGSLFEDSVLGGRRLPRGTGISSDDLGAGHSR